MYSTLGKMLGNSSWKFCSSVIIKFFIGQIILIFNLTHFRHTRCWLVHLLPSAQHHVKPMGLLHYSEGLALMWQKENHRDRLRECWWGTNLSMLLPIWAIVSCPLWYSVKACQSSCCLVTNVQYIPTWALTVGAMMGVALSALSTLCIIVCPVVLHCHVNHMHGWSFMPGPVRMG